MADPGTGLPVCFLSSLRDSRSSPWSLEDVAVNEYLIAKSATLTVDDRQHNREKVILSILQGTMLLADYCQRRNIAFSCG